MKDPFDELNDPMSDSSIAVQVSRLEMTVIDICQQYMDSNGLSISDLANKIGRTTSYLQRRMDGAVTWSLYDIARVQQAMGIKLDLTNRRK